MPAMSVRRPSPSRIQRTVRAAVPVAAVLGVLGGSAVATGAEVERQVVVDDVQVEHTVNPCSGVPGTFARTFQGVVQIWSARLRPGSSSGMGVSPETSPSPFNVG